MSKENKPAVQCLCNQGKLWDDVVKKWKTCDVCGGKGWYPSEYSDGED